MELGVVVSSGCSGQFKNLYVMRLTRGGEHEKLDWIFAIISSGKRPCDVMLLSCSTCGATSALAPQFVGCLICAERGVASVLEMASTGSEAPAITPASKWHSSTKRFRHVLPVDGMKDVLTLGEGNTPLVHSNVIGPRLGLANLYFKNEAANPTGSFKDRYVAVSVNLAARFGFEKIVVSSTGNLGVSVAAYAAAAGLDCVVLMPEDVPQAMVIQAQMHGATVIKTTSEGRLPLFEYLAFDRGWFPVGLFLPRRISNPFGVEGYKAIGYEIVEQLGEAPAAVLFPSARGNGLYGAWKGFREALAWGWSASIPAMVGCQPAGANSLEVSLDRNSENPVVLPPVQSIAFSTTETVASPHALAAIRASHGDAFSASDGEIVAATRALAGEGLCIETSSALPVACLPKMLERGLVSADDAVVCVLTATGLRSQGLTGDADPAVTIEPDPAALDRALGMRSPQAQRTT